MNPPTTFPCHFPRATVLVLVAGVALCLALPKEPPPSRDHFHRRISRRAWAARESLFEDVRIVPAIHCGGEVGVRLYAIRPGSRYAQLGLQNGDVIERVAGVSLTTADRALEAYAQARVRRVVPVDVRRRGRSLRFVYEIVE
jgi:general secretion pathway protein C